ncbi:glycosyltransferase family 4 protein [Brachybacterium hainanense]|uniref:D-inositol 3-phosphate glycosyltransferase n=1 Tax=Brachybacterium hainanense TaxID=1541174 RepID=A0ABV6RAX6_9MICO
MSESFLPHMNGVTGSVLQVVDQFAARGDDLAIIAPRQPGAERFLRTSCGRKIRVRRITSVPMLGYGDVRIATTSAASLRRRIADFQPDVVHLASPTILGGRAMIAAQQLGLPTVAVYQTDIPGYTARYGLPFLEAASWQLLRDVHNRATLTLAPSTFTRDQLREHGIERIRLWRRGVDTARFSPSLRSEALRAELAEPGERIVLYVGRLAPEKQVEDLRILHDLPGVRVVVVGEGPEEETLRRAMPRARFRGFRGGADLAAHLASADLFVHPGELETFCQTIQEAMASGLPAIAPRRGGPVDLIAPSRTGWLYTPGMLDELREHAVDLLFDDAKREAFGAAALASVHARTWPVLAEQLRGYYAEAIGARELSRRAP